MIRISVVLMMAVLATACRESVTAPPESKVALEVYAADVIHAATGTMPVPLQVLARDASSNEPLSDVQISWTVTAGAAALERSTAMTDEYGIARVTVTLPSLGESSVRASSERMAGAAPVFRVHAVERGEIQLLNPLIVAPGGQVVIEGRNFSAMAAENVVLFDGVRATVLDATTTRIRVSVPPCLPSRAVNVRAGIGYALSEGATLHTSGNDEGAINLEPAQVRTLTTAAELDCVQLAYAPDALYLLITQNNSSRHAPPRGFQLHALGSAPPTATHAAPAQAAQPFAHAWEARLREQERMLPPASPFDMPAVRVAVSTEVGDSRIFNVINQGKDFDRVTATVKLVTTHAIIYVDDESSSAFSSSDLQRLGELFDDPIHATVSGVYGAPSDIDANGRVMMLFTPRVNALTPRASSSFVAGFFYGCDLVSRTRCSGSNRGEIFYSMVPDPAGQWSDSRSVAGVMATVPAVLAHEFQHMIHFARRGFSTEVLWLAEAMAHTAEELVGDAITAAGNREDARFFHDGNYSRAVSYLADIDQVSLISEDSPGTLEMRGGAWLFLKYLRGHYGDRDLLRRLTQTTRSGVANVTAEVPRAWEDLVTDFAIATWATGTPTGNFALDHRHRYQDFRPRDVLIGRNVSTYPLRTGLLPWRDFAVSMTLPSTSMHYTFVSAGSSSGPLNMVLTGWHGAAIDTPGARLTVVRVR
ncbi:hypothetical protein BH23GEM10_BH23GEM10_07790 [soil metagenome]